MEKAFECVELVKFAIGGGFFRYGVVCMRELLHTNVPVS